MATRRTPEPDPVAQVDLRAGFARSADLMRERLRRLLGQEPRMSDVEYRAEMAWRDRSEGEQLAAWRKAGSR